MLISITDRPGRCRWCGCTERRACDGGCSWANPPRTVCSRCAPLDVLMRTAAGRKRLADAVAADVDEDRL